MRVQLVRALHHWSTAEGLRHCLYMSAKALTFTVPPLGPKIVFSSQFPHVVDRFTPALRLPLLLLLLILPISLRCSAGRLLLSE